MTDTLFLGVIQGIVEWLPVSSEGVLVLAQTILSDGGQTLSDMIAFSLYLHLGTFFAALVYFRHDVVQLIRALFSFHRTDRETRQVLIFLVIATAISGVIGGAFLVLLEYVEASLTLSAQIVTAGVGLLLLGTAFLQIRSGRGGVRMARDITNTDSVLLGIVQGFAALPGFSRSGLTVSALLLRTFRSRDALRLSFLMSLPIVLVGNIVLNFDMHAFSPEALLGLVAAFVAGFATIHLLLSVAERINFAYFVLIFGLATIGSAFLL